MFAKRHATILAAVILAALTSCRAAAEERSWNYTLRYSSPDPAPAWSSPQEESGLALSLANYQTPQAVEVCYVIERVERNGVEGIGSGSRPTLHPGLGQYFANDLVGRSRFGGAGLVDPPYAYLKLRFRF